MAVPQHLLLMRHAKSDWGNPDFDDHERPLNDRGRQAASDIGKRLREHNLEPDFAVVSSSTRTRETWDLLAPELESPPAPTYLEALYGASPQSILSLIRKTPASVTRLLVMSHNPSLAILARFLASDNGQVPTPERFLKFPTAAVAVFRILAANWQDTDPDILQFDRFFDPRSPD